MTSSRRNVLIVVCDSLGPNLVSTYGGAVGFALPDELADRRSWLTGQARDALYDGVGRSFPPASQLDEDMDTAVKSNLGKLCYIE